MTWTGELAAGRRWTVQTGSTQRVVEASSPATRMRRITEAGAVRITRRARDIAWTVALTPDATWSSDAAARDTAWTMALTPGTTWSSDDA